MGTAMNMLSRYLIIGIVMGAMGCNAAGMDKDKMDTSLATRKRSSPFEPTRATPSGSPQGSPYHSPMGSPRLPGGSPTDPYLFSSFGIGRGAPLSRSSSSTEISMARTLSGASATSLSSGSSQTSLSSSISSVQSSAQSSPLTPIPPSIPWEPSTKKPKIDKEQEEKKKKEAHEESTSESDTLKLDTPESTPEPKVPLALPPSSDTTVPIVARLKLPSPVGPTGDSPTTVTMERLQHFNLDGDKHNSDSFAVPAPRLPLSAQAVIKMGQEEKKKQLNAEREDSDEATELMEAVLAREVDEVQKLLSTSEAKKDINKKDAQGDTALHWAISQGMKDDAALLEIIKLLLANKADINMTGYSGQNAVETARTHYGSGPIVDLLVAHASKPTASSSG